MLCNTCCSIYFLLHILHIMIYDIISMEITERISLSFTIVAQKLVFIINHLEKFLIGSSAMCVF